MALNAISFLVYSISKQGTKVYTYKYIFIFFFWGGGGGRGEGRRRRGQRQSFEGHKNKLVLTENIGKLVGRRGTSQFISGELGNRLPAYCSKHSK